MKENTTLIAIVNIRNLILGLTNDWHILRTVGNAIDEQLEKASRMFINEADPIAHERWVTETGRVQQQITKLKSLLSKVSERIKAKNTNDLTDLWNAHSTYSVELVSCYQTMRQLGLTHLPKEKQDTWNTIWQNIEEKHNELQALAKASGTHLSMIGQYAPAEVDELTDTILRNMPKNYSEKDALQYEEEYMEAYHQLKKEASQKKNVWDRFLDILAGGAQQTPAQMVMMKRWVDGEKGNL